MYAIAVCYTKISSIWFFMSENEYMSIKYIYLYLMYNLLYLIFDTFNFRWVS